MAQSEVVQVGRSKRKKEVKMPQNETPPETNEQTGSQQQAEAEAEISSREAADLEERLSAERIAQARNESDAAGAEVEKQEVTLIGTLAKGRDHLLEQMRAHAQETAAKAVYTPPPMTDKMRAKIDEEIEAGRRAQAKHQLQWDTRPQKPHDPREGRPGTPVHRPNDVVPDPLLNNTTGFAAGSKRYSPDV